MAVALITGSAGLIGSQAVQFFASKGFDVVGIDSNMRKEFFGEEACTQWNLALLQSQVKQYTHFDHDIRDQAALEKIFTRYAKSISVIIHCAAQPSHDWATKDPCTDFTVNANGTLHLLEMTRLHCKDAVFMFLSTNKVYGDTPNRLPLVELEKRYEISQDHPYYGIGIPEDMSIDQCKHSLFGVSKAAADLMVQEYGRYFGLKTACFRGGCLTGPAHSGTQLHGFLSYLMRCAVMHTPYTIFGYGGKQVRDNIHSYDLVNALWHFYQDPKVGEVYNIGGGPRHHCSVLEAIEYCQTISGNEVQYQYEQTNRIGDHLWWISDVRKFQRDYPGWEYQYDLLKILTQIYDVTVENSMKKTHEFA